MIYWISDENCVSCCTTTKAPDFAVKTNSETIWFRRRFTKLRQDLNCWNFSAFLGARVSHKMLLWRATSPTERPEADASRKQRLSVEVYYFENYYFFFCLPRKALSCHHFKSVIKRARSLINLQTLFHKILTICVNCYLESNKFLKEP